jgi:hypothetical protein
MTGGEFDSFFNEIEDFIDDLTRHVAQSASVRESLHRCARVRRRKIKIRAYRRARLRVPDHQWFAPIKANAPPRGSPCR